MYDVIHSITLSIAFGTIWDASRVACDLAKQTGKPVEFVFNELDMRADRHSTPTELYDNYRARHEARYNARRNQQVR